MADVSMAFGGMYVSSSATTTLSADTPAKAAGTMSSMGLNGFSYATGALTYTGTATRVFEVQANGSVHSITGAETLNFYMYKNGSPITGARIMRKVSNNDVGAVGIGCFVSLATNDYVELYVSSLGGDDLVVDYGVILIRVAG